MCESDARCQAFLAKAWPGVPVWPDVRTFDLAYATGGQFSKHANGERESIQGWTESISGSQGVWLLTAGVPCQPASRAGKQRGKDDDRWLWKEACEVFAAIRPAWGLFENPPGIGDVGLAGILSDLGREGYAVRVFGIPACAIGAPHRRMRYWIVCKRLADASQPGCERTDAEPRAERLHSEHPEGESSGLGDTEESRSGTGLCESRQEHHRNGLASSSLWSNYEWLACADGKLRRAPSRAVLLADGLPVDLPAQLAKVHRSALGALGNSIVHQVAHEIIRAMIISENEDVHRV